MRCSLPILLPMVLALPVGLAAQQADSAKAELIRNALSAAPPSLAEGATVVDLQERVLRQGTNGWVCLPDMPEVPNDSPMCLDEPWRELIDAWMSRREPRITRVGIGYMLRGDMPTSNTDPFATGPAPGNQWLPEGLPHIMLIVPDRRLLEGLPTDPENGGPWVMWKGTPYEHVMLPTVPRTD